MLHVDERPTLKMFLDSETFVSQVQRRHVEGTIVEVYELKTDRPLFVKYGINLVPTTLVTLNGVELVRHVGMIARTNLKRLQNAYGIDVYNDSRR